MQAAQFLRQKFRDYYRAHRIESVPAIEQREFGIGEFGKKISQRHLAFKSVNELNSFLQTEVPFYISYSCAYYRFPASKPMEAKAFEKADLIYEFDADDLRTDCKQAHDSWLCEKCGAKGKGAVEACTGCGSAPKLEQWVCDECLGEVKKQVLQLLEILHDDFGLTGGMSINYSGSKGYHIHVRSADIQKLPQHARVELVDYLTAEKIDFRNLGFYLDENKRFVCPTTEFAKGWAGKLLQEAQLLFERGNAEEIAVAGAISVRESKELLKDFPKIVRGIKQGMLLQLPGRKTEKFWTAVLQYCTERLKLKIDRQTSVDIAKIVRVPETIHGGSGLLAKSLPVSALKGFEPLKEAVAFGDAPVKLRIKKTPKFSLNGCNFGPFENAETDLPEFAAVYLLAAGKAEIV